MWIPLLHDVITALMAAGISLGAAWLWFRARGQSRIRSWTDRAMDQVATELQGRIRRGVEEALADPAVDRRLQDVEDRVRRGVVDGMAETQLKETLDALGDEVEARVRRGVTEGVRSLATPETLKDTTLTISEAGANFFGESLNALLGSPRKPRPPENAD
jgi:hypothetical protein